MTEKWLPAKGFEGRYEVSDQGRMRRIKNLGSGRFAKGYILNPKPNSRGYLRTTLYVDGKRHNIAIHLIVLKTFVGPRPPGHVTNHKNGDKTDNRLDNLEWVSQAENVAHAIEHDLFSFTPKGEDHPNAKLTEDDVKEIRQLYATGEHTQIALADRFGVSDVMISYIVNRKSWKHI